MNRRTVFWVMVTILALVILLSIFSELLGIHKFLNC